MPRIRTIKPEFWGDEKLALLDPITRLVFLGLISMADDYGRLLDNVKSIDGMLFPNTDDTCRDSLETLARLSRIIRYTSASGQKLIQITNWHHQKVDHPSKAIFPPPPNHQTVDSKEDSGKARASVATPSRPDLVPSTNDQRSTTTADADLFFEVGREFEVLWPEYPKRAGGNSKSDALRQFRTRRKEGVTLEALTEGTARYKAFCDATGKIGTELVMAASRFFGRGRYFEEQWEIPKNVTPVKGGSLDSRAEKTWRLMVRSGVHTGSNAEVRQAIIDQLVESGEVKDGARFLSFLRSLDKTLLARLSAQGDDKGCIRHIAEKLSDSPPALAVVA